MALGVTQGTLSGKDPREILRNYYLRAGDGQLTVVTTTLDLTTVYTLPAEVGVPGAVVVSGETFLKVVEGVTAPQVTLATDGTGVVLTAGSFEARLATMGAEDFPKDPFFSGECQAVDRPELLAGLRRISLALCKDESRKQLNNVRVDKNSLTSSDGRVTVVVSVKTGVTGEVLVPSRAIKRLTDVLADARTPTVEVAHEGGHLLFRFGGVTFSTRLGAGAFPDVRGRVLKPTENNPLVLRIHREGLRAAVARVAATASKRGRSVRLDLQRGRCSLLAQDWSGNSSSESVECDFGMMAPDGRLMECTPTQVFFDHQYLASVLATLTGELVEFRMAQQIRVPVRVEEPGLVVLMARLSAAQASGGEAPAEET